MPDVSLTEFVDFVIKAGSPKLTQVRKIKNKPPYEPAIDFWKQLREALIDHHKSGPKKKTDLDGFLSTVTDKKRMQRYVPALAGYKKFLGKSTVTWFAPPSNIWTFGTLNVRVNPELGLIIDGSSYVVKLYFKEEAPTKNRLETVFEVMRLALQSMSPTGSTMAVLDVNRAKLNETSQIQSSLQPLLEGEAASFIRIWESI